MALRTTGVGDSGNGVLSANHFNQIHSKGQAVLTNNNITGGGKAGGGSGVLSETLISQIPSTGQGALANHNQVTVNQGSSAPKGRHNGAGGFRNFVA